MPSLTLSSRIFPSKAAAAQAIRDIRGKYRPLQNVSDQADHAFLLAVLRQHPDASRKIAVGVAFFTAVTTPFGKPGFIFTRVDGSSDDFSWSKCLDGRNVKQDVLQAFRRVVEDDVRKFRDMALAVNPVSALSGAPVSRSNCHVDHAFPKTFSRLVASFLEKHRATFDSIDMTYDVELEFLIYHRKNAVLRLLCDAENLSAGNRAPEAI